jgi:hypothetical protein
LGYSYFNTRKTCLMKNMRKLQFAKNQMSMRHIK